MPRLILFFLFLLGLIILASSLSLVRRSTKPATLSEDSPEFAWVSHQTPPKLDGDDDDSQESENSEESEQGKNRRRRKKRNAIFFFFFNFGPSCPNEPRCSSVDREYRKIDGSCNNLENPSFGQSGLPFIRFTPRQDHITNCGVGTSDLPNPREVSSLTIKRSEVSTEIDMSTFVMTWGQIVDHDIELTPLRQTPDDEFLDCCVPENRQAPDCCPLFAPSNDPFYGVEGRPRCISFLRSKLGAPGGCRGDRRPDVVNANTPWIDGSFVYGSDNKRAAMLRTFAGGLMKTSKDKRNRDFPMIDFKDGKAKMEFGDTRGDVHPGATILTTVFLRNHNRIAQALAQLHPNFNDERLFQEARKINSAIVQHITYTQFIDGLLGTPNNVGLTDFNGRYTDFYNSSLNGAISMGFGTAGFRLHTYVAGSFQLRDRNFVKHKDLQLRDVFHNPLITMADETYDDMIRGMCGQPLHKFDNEFSPEMTEWLFREKEKNFGLDIAALNVQRGRDHQIPGYASYREFCGLGKADSWKSFLDLIPGDLVHRLLHVYKRPEDVDLYVAGNMESPLVGSILGPTFHCLIREQFERLRNADRFFYSNRDQFTPQQLGTISRQTLSSVMCVNADNPADMSLPSNVFKMVDNVRNPLFPCNAHPVLDMNAWRSR